MLSYISITGYTYSIGCSRSLLMQSGEPHTEINEPSYKLSRSRLHFIYFKLLSFLIQVIIESLRRSQRYYPSEGNCIVTVLKYGTQLMVWKRMFEILRYRKHFVPLRNWNNKRYRKHLVLLYNLTNHFYGLI